MNHYTNRRGYHAIRATRTWCFKARKQRTKSKPFGAYFTTLLPTDVNFVKRVRLPRNKREYRFSFTGRRGLVPLPGPGGKDVFYSPTDYFVHKPRQVYCGRA